MSNVALGADLPENQRETVSALYPIVLASAAPERPSLEQMERIAAPSSIRRRVLLLGVVSTSDLYLA